MLSFCVTSKVEGSPPYDLIPASSDIKTLLSSEGNKQMTLKQWRDKALMDKIEKEINKID